MAPLDLKNKRFNSWTVINGPILNRGRRYWLCKCVCGASREVDGSNLKNGISKSCGCQHAPHTSTDKHKQACAENSKAKAEKLKQRQLSNYVVDLDGCWIWQGVLDKDGYGKVKRDTKTIRAHRLFYEQHVGPVPNGLLVLHHCDNPQCVNPSHLYIGNQFDNERDKDTRGRRVNGYGKCKQK